MTTPPDPSRDARRRLAVMAERSLVGAELSGVDLSGCRLAYLDLRGATLDGADLRDTTFEHVDLSEASLRGARLERTRWRNVEAAHAQLDGAVMRRAGLQRVNWTSASLKGVDLSGSLLNQCALEDARCDDLELVDAHLVYSMSDRATFRGACFASTVTLGSSFAGADFSLARRITTCREIVVEILRSAAGDDVELLKLLGLAAVERRFCFAAWARLLGAQPGALRIVADCLDRYPASGLLEALCEGARVANLGPLDALLEAT